MKANRRPIVQENEDLGPVNLNEEKPDLITAYDHVKEEQEYENPLLYGVHKDVKYPLDSELEYPETPPELFIKKSYEDAEKDLLKFVEEQIQLMNNNLLFKGQEEPSFYALNRSLMEYESVNIALIALHNEMRIQKDIATEKYDDFYAQKYVEIKNGQVTLAGKFTAAKEIDMLVRNTYIKELATLKADVIRLENKYNFVNHLIEAWARYAFVLTNLSKNSQSEANAGLIANKHQYEFGDENVD